VTAGPAPTYGMTILLLGRNICIQRPPEIAPPRYKSQNTLLPCLFMIFLPKLAIIIILKTESGNKYDMRRIHNAKRHK